ncbi:hypothetical protein [uncultured Microbacterium sp.]|uniref:hypothetical protein n=1 Tax=uncultured Microbacterium sp. TaxID=191216 RepID=UPI0025E93009|nr:hypothetical protein [uncultured Microbacterium sp.]
MSMTPAVAQAIAELTAQFPDSVVTATESGDGGAWVHVDPVPIGNRFTHPTSWVAFHLTFTYPDADVYPHFVRADLVRVDGQGLGEGFSSTTFGPDATPAIQISRRSPETLRNDATAKLIKVLDWMRDR